MFVYNVKINGSKTFKFIFALMIIFLICILGVVIFKVFNGAMNSENTSSCIPQNRVNKITANIPKVALIPYKIKTACFCPKPFATIL
jgi:hypothetical protein